MRSTPYNKNCRIFFLDDDVFFLEYLKYKSACWGRQYQYSFFSSSVQMLEQLSLAPEVVVLDFKLGDGPDGPLYAHHLIDEMLKVNPRTKIIFLSGMENDEVLFEYARFRQIHYLSKSSFELDRLGNLIVHCLQERKPAS